MSSASCQGLQYSAEHGRGSTALVPPQHGLQFAGGLNWANHAMWMKAAEAEPRSGICFPSGASLIAVGELGVSNSMVFGDHHGHKQELYTEQFARDFNSRMGDIEEVQRSIARACMHLEEEQTNFLRDFYDYADDSPENQIMERESELNSRKRQLSEEIQTLRETSQFIEEHRTRFLSVSEVNLDLLKKLEKESISTMLNKSRKQFHDCDQFRGYKRVRDGWSAWQKAILESRTNFHFRQSATDDSIMEVRIVLTPSQSNPEHKESIFLSRFRCKFEDSAQIPRDIWDWYPLCNQHSGIQINSDSDQSDHNNGTQNLNLILQEDQKLNETEKLYEKPNFSVAHLQIGAIDGPSDTSAEDFEEVITDPLYRNQQLSGGSEFYRGIGPNKPDMSGMNDEERELFDRTLEDRRYPCKFGYYE